jgi:hypothetical protein
MSLECPAGAGEKSARKPGLTQHGKGLESRQADQ